MLRIVYLALLAALAASALPQSAAAGSCGNRTDFGRGRKLDVVALTQDQRLVRFKECSPTRVREIAPVTGLGGADTSLVGIDFRAKDGLLYGVGNGGGVYQIDTQSAVATPVSQLTATLEGAFFGVDFNPAADRLRVVSDTGQNLRHNLDDDTTTPDMPLKNGDATATGVAAAGYTNNDLDTNTGTTLFDVDTALDQLSIQSPPNNGNLIPTGKLGVDAGSTAGFDVYTGLRSGVAVSNWGFAALSVGGTPGFYRVNLLTGQAVLIGPLGGAVTDIALPLDQ
jgi:hypothetical protein